MKKFFKNNDWREALPILYYMLRFYVLYEIIRLVESSNRSNIFKIIMSILIVCFYLQWALSETNKKE